MKCIGWKMSSGLAACLLTMLVMARPTSSLAQEAGASIHGHVTNPIGQPLNKGEVKLTTDRTSPAQDRKFPYTFPVDQNGDYKGSGIAPGTYVVVVFQDDKSLDFVDSAVFSNGDNKQVDFDMSRKEYLDKMTPEEKKQLEEYRKKNAEVTAGNAKIANLNATLVQARADTKAGN